MLIIIIIVTTQINPISIWGDYIIGYDFLAPALERHSTTNSQTTSGHHKKLIFGINPFSISFRINKKKNNKLFYKHIFVKTYKNMLIYSYYCQFGVTTLLVMTFLLLHLRNIATQTFIQLLDSIRGQRWDNRTLGHSKFLYRHEKRCEPANLVL